MSKKRMTLHSTVIAEEFTLGIDPKSLQAMVLIQTVCNAVVQYSRRFLKHMVISVTEKGRITVAA